MTARGLVDVLIPRGGAGLIRSVVEDSTVPVIETGVGNCHVYVDADADLDKAVAILRQLQGPARQRLQRRRDVPGARATSPTRSCRARSRRCARPGVTVHGDARIAPYAAGRRRRVRARHRRGLGRGVLLARHRRRRRRLASTTRSRTSAAGRQRAHRGDRDRQPRRPRGTFVAGVDAAAVMVNASTRFTDGGEFGFGAEIGISTQKLHARGPMGLPELTSTTYVVTGDGHIRG